MVSHTLLFLLASSVYLGVLGQEPETQAIDSNLGSACCDALRAALPSLVFARGTPEYITRHQTYYSLQQQELFPNCTVKPNSAQDVSLVLKIAKTHQCVFAVASGGHMSWKGSSNIDGGFVIDMRALNQIDISVKDQTVKLGPGSQWTTVYAAMAPFNVTTTGARINSVGVGGFLLGGGIAFASVTKGFAADNVFNYEIVLADGSITTASKTKNADLFWALKLGSTNYGIVTRYDMTTSPSAVIWGAVSAYPITNQSVSELLSDFQTYGHDTKNTKNFKSVAFAQSGGVGSLSTVQANLDGIPQPPGTSVAPSVHAELVGTTHDVIDQVIAGALAATARAHWFTFTTKIDQQFFKDLYAKGDQIFKPLNNRDGLSWFMSFQSLQKSYIAKTAGTPIFNTLNQSNDDLVINLILVTWTDPADESVMRKATDSLGKWGETEARKRGLLNDFVYLNYANEEQLIYTRSVTKDDLDKMRTVQKKYDPSGMLNKLWRGGYKLPKAGYNGFETSAAVQEEQDGLITAGQSDEL
ncbi:hypothetical protein E1B28_011606 [Marasmius oreades]|uniref:FAD-binding PCMH-type domain-containing protein n=1 Tax=Marasmius oreades TaxID=181124 RepID=A0A9P7RVU5_9AGAR|nr:uncharacterized protein E1B28_011606 [Marasmius oreades]KAG7089983.1 hypothetical protein E1B28_011606 [Marasmius oreades]